MKRAYQRALSQNAISERSSLVRTCGLSCKHRPIAAAEYGDGYSMHLKPPAFSQWDAIDIAEVCEYLYW